MRAAGIIAEYNPFHSGHAYQIEQTRRRLGPECAVVCCMSGCWVQSGAPAAADKWTRAHIAALGGADLVVELPALWAVSSAETFAWGGVSLLAASGLVTDLSFGSECGDADVLAAAAECLDSDEYRAGLRRFLDEGMSFAACRQAVAEGLLGREGAAVLTRPNDNLGVEYLRALRRLNAPIRPLAVRREGAGYHDCGGERARFVSATQVRRWLSGGEWAAAEPYLIPGETALLRGAGLCLPPQPGAERAVLARLRTMTAADWAQLPDSGAAEGLPARLERAGRAARSLEEFYALAKTKRYPHARLRRLALWAFLGLRADDRPARPPYLRVLAMNGRGRALLREMKRTALLPVVTKTAHVRALDGDCRRVFELEARCTDLYDLLLPEPPAGGREWREGPAIL